MSRRTNSSNQLGLSSRDTSTPYTIKLFRLQRLSRYLCLAYQPLSSLKETLNFDTCLFFRRLLTRLPANLWIRQGGCFFWWNLRLTLADLSYARSHLPQRGDISTLSTIFTRIGLESSKIDRKTWKTKNISYSSKFGVCYKRKLVVLVLKPSVLRGSFIPTPCTFFHSQ